MQAELLVATEERAFYEGAVLQTKSGISHHQWLSNDADLICLAGPVVSRCTPVAEQKTTTAEAGRIKAKAEQAIAMLPNMARDNGVPESQMVQGLLQEGRARIVAGDVGGALKVRGMQHHAARCTVCCVPWRTQSPLPCWIPCPDLPGCGCSAWSGPLRRWEGSRPYCRRCTRPLRDGKREACSPLTSATSATSSRRSQSAVQKRQPGR